MSTGSRVFSAGHGWTDIAVYTIWILHTSAFILFFFLYSIQKLLVYYLNFTEALI